MLATLTARIERAEAPRVLIVQPNRNYLGVLARRIAEGGYRVATAEYTPVGDGRASPRSRST